MKFTRAFSLILLAATVIVSTSVLAQQPPARHVVVITVDGLKPATYTAPGPSKVPTLRRLAQEGTFADGVIGVTPTVTYPSHTTMITGVMPAVHGIYNNLILDPEQTSNSSWYWYARDIKVPTLFSAVKARGLTTAAVSWPVTVDADIDYLMPEFGGVTRNAKWLDLMRGISRPRLLLDDYEAQGRPLAWPMTDDDRTGLAAFIMRKYPPNLMLLHIFGTDDAQHKFGPDTPEALASIEVADGHVAQMIKAVADAGIQDRTDFVVLSDHGFLPLGKQLQPNFAFKRDGLLKVDEAREGQQLGRVLLRRRRFRLHPAQGPQRQRAPRARCGAPQDAGRRSCQRHPHRVDRGRPAQSRRRSARVIRHRHARRVLYGYRPRCPPCHDIVERRSRVRSDATRVACVAHHART